MNGCFISTVFIILIRVLNISTNIQGTECCEIKHLICPYCCFIAVCIYQAGSCAWQSHSRCTVIHFSFAYVYFLNILNQMEEILMLKFKQSEWQSLKRYLKCQYLKCCSDQLCLPVYVFLLLSSYANEHTGKVSKALLQLTKILVQYIMMQRQWILISMQISDVIFSFKPLWICFVVVNITF